MKNRIYICTIFFFSFLLANGQNTETKHRRLTDYYLIDIEGSKIMPDSIRAYDKIEEFNSSKNLYRGYRRVQLNEKWALLDSLGHILTSFSYDDIGSYMEGLLIPAKKDGKYGLINIDEQVIVPFKYDDYGYFSLYQKPKLLKVYINSPDKKKELVGVIDRRTGEEIVPCIYDAIGDYDERREDAKAEIFYITVTKDNKRGVVKKYGDVVIPIEYTTMKYWNDCRSDRTVVLNGEKFDENGNYISEMYTVLDLEGNVIMQHDDYVRMGNKLGKIRSGKKYALIDTLGNVLTPYIYDQIEMGKNERFAVGKIGKNRDKEEYVLDNSGKVVLSGKHFRIRNDTIISMMFLEKEYEEVYYDASAQIIGRAYKGKNYSFSSEKPEDIRWLAYEPGKIKFLDEENKLWPYLPPFTRKPRVGYTDGNRKLVIPYKYVGGDDFTDQGYAIVSKNGKKVGIIDKNDNVILPFKYDGVVFTTSNKLLIENNKKAYFAEIDGRRISDKNYDKMERYGRDAYIASRNDQWGVVDNNGIEIIPFQYEQIVDYGNILSGTRNGKKGNLNAEGKEIISCIYDHTFKLDNYICVRSNGKNGLFDLTGKEFLPCIYKEIYITNYRGEKMIYVNADDKWGVLDANGKVLAETIYVDKPKPLIHQGKLYFIGKKNECIYDGCTGMFDTSGNTIMPFKHRKIEPFGDLFIISTKYIDKENNNHYE